MQHFHSKKYCVTLLKKKILKRKWKQILENSLYTQTIELIFKRLSLIFVTYRQVVDYKV